jgi:hypothetical protein
MGKSASHMRHLLQGRIHMFQQVADTKYYYVYYSYLKFIFNLSY